MKRISIKNYLMILSMIFISSCATPSIEKMKSEISDYNLPQKNNTNDTLVYIVRPSKMAGLVKFNIFLDNKEKTSEMAYNEAGEFVYFFVKPGTHKIFSKAENWAEIEINGKTKEIIFLKQEVQPGFIIARNQLKKIDEIEAKYYIKNAALGKILKPSI